jgi:hypothetical protein
MDLTTGSLLSTATLSTPLAGEAVAVPEPGAASLLIGAADFVFAARRRKSVY